MSERTYTDEQLVNIDPPPFEYDGKTYTAYEATQMQRRIEREIRKQKRRKTAFEAAGLTDDATAANIKLRRLNQKYKEFSKAAGLPEQRDRMKVLYADNSTSARKSAGKDVSISPAGVPEQIGTVDFEDKKAVLKQLDLAQAETKELDHEVNYSVTTDGKVWRVLGEASTVNPSDIPSSLVGSYSFHNHPSKKTWFSFSADDVRFFFKSGEQFAKAADYLYEYIMERTKDTVAIDPDVVYYRFKEIEDSEVAQLKWDMLIDPDIDGYHETMKRLSKELKFHYERKKRK